MLNNLIIFVLAAFVGTEVLTKVPQTLHTPLMSGANAISGITVVGALVAAGMTTDPGGPRIGRHARRHEGPHDGDAADGIGARH